MTDEPDHTTMVTALMLLRPASGEPITGETVITAESLARYAPDHDEAGVVAGRMREAGFRVGPLVGIAMTVTAPRTLFEAFFRTSVVEEDDGGWTVAGGGRELPLSSLPPGLAGRILAVTFDEPAEPVGP